LTEKLIETETEMNFKTEISLITTPTWHSNILWMVRTAYTLYGLC